MRELWQSQSVHRLRCSVTFYNKEMAVADPITKILLQISDINENIVRLELKGGHARELQCLLTEKAELMKCLDVCLETQKIDLERQKLEEQKKQREMVSQNLKDLEECRILLSKTKTELTNCEDDTVKAKLRETLAELEIREVIRKSNLDSLQICREGGQSEMMSVMLRMEKSLQENLSATRNASRIDQKEWDQVLLSLQLSVVPVSGDPPEVVLKRPESVAFW
mmetsp:Transcript_52570/g.109668  ORF Transcript_52570/g.109668 Transcript_52570/m.109668 type:complete len:224 (-) Transcript_52570:144-815(-)